MKFVFTNRLFLLLSIGFVLLSAGWFGRGLLYATLGYDLILMMLIAIDYYLCETEGSLRVTRIVEDRFSMGADNPVRIRITNRTNRPVEVCMKDEYPADMQLRSSREARLRLPANRSGEWHYSLLATARGDFQFGDTAVRLRSRFGLLWRQLRFPTSRTIRVYPNIQEARKNELYAHRNRDLKHGHRRMRVKGAGREFESLREFVIGDEVRHISWPATARRGKLITRQYTVERSQNIMVMLDAGRLMTARIGDLTKLDHAINATLSIAYVAVAGGDNVGLLAFSRRVISFIPPRRGRDQINRVMEALYNIEPQLIEPSYSRAFNFLGLNCHRRSLVVILTDLVDRDASAELLSHASKLAPHHLPLIVTIGDSDLRALVRRSPQAASDVYRQSVAEEILRQREEALSRIHQLGGLALDVPAGRLSFELVNKYLDVKERGLL